MKHTKKWKVYQYGRCDTCRKALKFLDARNVAYEALDITETPPTLAELKRMVAAVGDVRKLFNTSGQVYRDEGIGKKLPGLGVDEALRLLAGNGRLVKRPFALFEAGGLVGFREEAWASALGDSPDSD